MQSSHILALTIVLAALAYGLVERWLKERKHIATSENNQEATLMQQRIDELEERVRVLEQIVTDPKESLSRKINSL